MSTIKKRSLDDDQSTSISYVPTVKKSAMTVADPFATLPDELVTSILTRVTSADLVRNVTLVDRRFRRLGHDSVTMLDLDELAREEREDEEMEAYRAGHSWNGSRQRRTDWKEIRAGGRALLSRCPRIRRLRLETPFDSESIAADAQEALNTCPMLEVLEWINCRDEFVSHLFRATTTRRKEEEEKGLVPLKFRSLTRVKVSVRNKKNKRFFVRRCTRKERVRGSSCWCHMTCEVMGGLNTFLRLARDSLESVVLPVDAFWDQSYARLGQCQILERVRLEKTDDNGGGLTARGLGSILAVACLTELDLTTVDDDGRLSRGRTLQDQDLAVAVSGRRLESLRSLRLFVSHPSYNGPGLGDLALKAVAKACPELRVLWLGHELPSVTNAGFKTNVLKRCGKLERLTLKGFSNLTPAAFKDLGRKLPGLKYLCLEDCPKIGRGFRRRLRLRTGIDVRDFSTICRSDSM